MRTSPREYGLPHGSWRTHQHEAVQELLTLEPGETVVMEAPTGSGKTGVVTALAVEWPVMALSHTKMLQQANYAGTYGYVHLFGKGNYNCPMNGGRASMCSYDDVRKCPQYSACPYYIRKREIINSRLAALNYAYFLAASQWSRSVASGRVLVMDECDLLPELILEHSSVTVDVADRGKWGLPPFERITTRGSAAFGFPGISQPEDAAADWLERSILRMKVQVNKLKHQFARHNRDKDLHKQKTDAEALYYRLAAVRESIDESPKDWFIRSGPGARELPGGRTANGFVCKPLTARHHAASRLLHGERNVLMSATIGDFGLFCEELGINGHREIRVPNQWAPEVRPVYYFDGGPRIGRSADEKGYDEQARLIAQAINSVPRSWSGVILCTSKQAAFQLRNLLAEHHGMYDRVWTPNKRTGTNQQMNDWVAEKKRRPNAIAITWSWWSGVDLLDERILICAKIPYGFIGSDYTRAKMQYSGKVYQANTARRLIQGCGRTRRGRPGDYDINGKQNGLVVIADENWHRIRSYLSPDFLEAMVPWPGG